MPDRSVPPFACAFLVVLMIASTGCTGVSIGEVSYSKGMLDVPVTNTGAESEAFVQVTVYEIVDFHQQEFLFVQEPVTLNTGENAVSVPVDLPPGDYKLYVYVLKPGERETATIRDIRV